MTGKSLRALRRNCLPAYLPLTHLPSVDDLNEAANDAARHQSSGVDEVAVLRRPAKAPYAENAIG